MNRVQAFSDNRRSGYTLTELIVVITIVLLLGGGSVMGAMKWTGWSEMNRQDEYARTLFIAAQNQMTEYSQSGQLPEFESAVRRAGAQNITSLIGSLKSSSGSPYQDIWTNAAKAGIAGNERKNYEGSVFMLQSSVPDQRAIIENMFCNYLYDQSVLKGNICIELSADDGQVFAVFYSDRNYSSYHYGSSDAADGGILDRSYRVRREGYLGYYGVDSLSKATSTKAQKPVISGVKLENGDLLSLDFFLSSVSSATRDSQFTYEITVFDGKTDLPVLGLLFPGSSIKNLSIDADVAGNTISSGREGCSVMMYREDGTTEELDGYPILLWGEEELGKDLVHVVLDAADLAAARYTDPEEIKGTFSFRRFGLETSEIYCEVRGSGSYYKTTAIRQSNKEDVRFGSEREEENEAAHITETVREISSARHLYNIRYEEEHRNEASADPSSDRPVIYQLTDDIDWQQMHRDGYIYNNKAAEGTICQKAASENCGVCSLTVNGDSGSRTEERALFPTISALRSNTILTGLKEGCTAHEDCYRISGITVREAEAEGSQGVSAEVYAGLIGLNAGTITDLTLDDIYVEGQKHAGAFCGQNSGTLAYLTVDSTPDRPSAVVGVQNVGGITGSQVTESMTASDTEVLSHLVSRADVAGRFYVGGIVGELSAQAGTILVEDCASYGRTGVTSDRISVQGSTQAGESLQPDEAGWIGGITGYAGDHNGAGHVELKNCTASPQYSGQEIDDLTGNAEALNKKLKGIYVGGIVGYNDGAVLTNCDTVKENSSREGYVFGYRYVGGIMGYNAGCSTKVQGGTGRNEANVIGDAYVGGIVGCNALLSGDKADIDTSVPEPDGSTQQGSGSGTDTAPGTGSGTGSSGSQSGQSSNDKYTIFDYIYDLIFGGRGSGGSSGSGSTQPQQPEDQGSGSGSGGSSKEGTNPGNEGGTDGGSDIDNETVTVLTSITPGIPDSAQTDKAVTADWANTGIVVAREGYAGGIAGFNAGIIENCSCDVPDNDSTRKLTESSCMNGDFAGGIAGYNNGIIRTSLAGRTEMIICRVSGVNYVGGIVGYNDCDGDISSDYRILGGYVKGTRAGEGTAASDSCYVGGYVGLNASAKLISQNRDHVILAKPNEVSGTYFAGGIIGGNIVPDHSSVSGNIYEAAFTVDNTLGSIKAAAAAGGLIGYNDLVATVSREDLLAAVNASCEKMKEAGGDPEKIPEILADLRNAADGVKLTGSHKELILTGNRASDNEKSTGYVRVGSVSADLYAGGVIGCNAEDAYLTVSHMDNASVIRAAKSVSNEKEAGQGNTDHDPLKEAEYSYAGGITGRVTPNMILDDCRNIDTADVKTKGTYLGGLAEINEGIIRNCHVSSLGTSSDKHVGGIAGINKARSQMTMDRRGDEQEASSLAKAAVIRNTVLADAVITGKDLTGGIVSVNFGEIRGMNGKITVRGYSKEDEDGCVGGIAGQNDGDICLTGEMTADILAASSVRAGGAAGKNTGSIYAESSTDTQGAVIGGTVRASDLAGGIAGVNEGDDSRQGRITDLTCSCEVTAVKGNAGGIAGKNQGIIENCVYGGTETAKTAAPEAAGGIAGINDNGGIIRECETGLSDISGQGTAQRPASIGGIAGNNMAGAIISNSLPGINGTASVHTGEKAYGNAGGIAGTNSGTVTETGYVRKAGREGQAVSHDSMDYSLIDSSKTEISCYLGHAGGIAGYNRKTGDITEAVTGWDWTVNVSGIAKEYGCGGICGYSASESGLRNCINRADVTKAGSGVSGGMIGRQECSTARGVLIDSCINYGRISAKDSASGIVGSAKYYGFDIRECINYGEIEITGTSGAAGGMLGYFEGFTSSWGTLTISGCENHGYIKGISGSSECLGGIVGRGTGSSVYRLEDCVNTGLITPALSSGGILGTAQYHKDSVIRGCHNYGTGYDSNEIGGIISRGSEGEICAFENFNLTELTLPVMDYSGSEAYDNYYVVDEITQEGSADSGAYIAKVEGSSSLLSEAELWKIVTDTADKSSISNAAYFKKGNLGSYTFTLSKKISLTGLELYWEKGTGTQRRAADYLVEYKDPDNGAWRTFANIRNSSVSYNSRNNNDNIPDVVNGDAVMTSAVRITVNNSVSGSFGSSSDCALLRAYIKDNGTIIPMGTEGSGRFVPASLWEEKEMTLSAEGRCAYFICRNSSGSYDQVIVDRADQGGYRLAAGMDRLTLGYPGFAMDLHEEFKDPANEVSTDSRLTVLGDDQDNIRYRAFKVVDPYLNTELEYEQGAYQSLAGTQVTLQSAGTGTYRASWKEITGAGFYEYIISFYQKNDSAGYDLTDTINGTSHETFAEFLIPAGKQDSTDRIGIEVRGGRTNAEGTVYGDYAGAVLDVNGELPLPEYHLELEVQKGTDEQVFGYRVYLDNREAYDNCTDGEGEVIDAGEIVISVTEADSSDLICSFSVQDGCSGLFDWNRGRDAEVFRFRASAMYAGNAVPVTSGGAVRESMMADCTKYTEYITTSEFFGSDLKNGGFYGGSDEKLSYRVGIGSRGGWMMGAFAELTAKDMKLGVPVSLAYDTVRTEDAMTEMLSLQELPDDLMDLNHYADIQIRSYPAEFEEGFVMTGHKAAGSVDASLLEDLTGGLYVGSHGSISAEPTQEPLIRTVFAGGYGVRRLENGRYAVEYSGSLCEGQKQDGYSLSELLLLYTDGGALTEAQTDTKLITERRIADGFILRRKENGRYDIWYNALIGYNAENGFDRTSYAFEDQYTQNEVTYYNYPQDGSRMQPAPEIRFDDTDMSQFKISWDTAHTEAEEAYENVWYDYVITGTGAAGETVIAEMTAVQDKEAVFDTGAFDLQEIKAKVLRRGEVNADGKTTVFRSVSESVYTFKTKFTQTPQPVIELNTRNGRQDREGQYYRLTWQMLPEMTADAIHAEEAFDHFEVTVKQDSDPEGNVIRQEEKDWDTICGIFAQKSRTAPVEYTDEDGLHRIYEWTVSDAQGRYDMTRRAELARKDVSGGYTIIRKLDLTYRIYEYMEDAGYVSEVLDLNDFADEVIISAAVRTAAKSGADAGSYLYRDSDTSVPAVTRLHARMDVPSLAGEVTVTAEPVYDEQSCITLQQFLSEGITIRAGRNPFTYLQGRYETAAAIFESAQGSDVTEKNSDEWKEDALAAVYGKDTAYTMTGDLNTASMTLKPDESWLADPSAEAVYTDLTDLAGRWIKLVMRASSESAVSSQWSDEDEEACNTENYVWIRIPRLKLQTPAVTEQTVREYYGWDNDAGIWKREESGNGQSAVLDRTALSFGGISHADEYRIVICREYTDSSLAEGSTETCEDEIILTKDENGNWNVSFTTDQPGLSSGSGQMSGGYIRHPQAYASDVDASVEGKIFLYYELMQNADGSFTMLIPDGTLKAGTTDKTLSATDSVSVCAVTAQKEFYEDSETNIWYCTGDAAGFDPLWAEAPLMMLGSFFEEPETEGGTLETESEELQSESESEELQTESESEEPQSESESGEQQGESDNGGIRYEDHEPESETAGTESEAFETENENDRAEYEYNENEKEVTSEETGTQEKEAVRTGYGISFISRDTADVWYSVNNGSAHLDHGDGRRRASQEVLTVMTDADAPCIAIERRHNENSGTDAFAAGYHISYMDWIYLVREGDDYLVFFATSDQSVYAPEQKEFRNRTAGIADMNTVCLGKLSDLTGIMIPCTAGPLLRRTDTEDICAEMYSCISMERTEEGMLLHYLLPDYSEMEGTDRNGRHTSQIAVSVLAGREDQLDNSALLIWEQEPSGTENAELTAPELRATQIPSLDVKVSEESLISYELTSSSAAEAVYQIRMLDGGTVVTDEFISAYVQSGADVKSVAYLAMADFGLVSTGCEIPDRALQIRVLRLEGNDRDTRYTWSDWTTVRHLPFIEEEIPQEWEEDTVFVDEDPDRMGADAISAEDDMMYGEEGGVIIEEDEDTVSAGYDEMIPDASGEYGYYDVSSYNEEYEEEEVIVITE